MSVCSRIRAFFCVAITQLVVPTHGFAKVPSNAVEFTIKFYELKQLASGGGEEIKL